MLTTIYFVARLLQLVCLLILIVLFTGREADCYRRFSLGFWPPAKYISTIIWFNLLWRSINGPHVV